MELESRYEFLEKVGAGSFATVFRARDHELGREVAIKQIHANYLADPSSLDRYWKEAQLLASLQHPNIVTIFDIIRARGWLIMELMQSNLRDRMNGKPMDLASLRTAVAHSLRALKYLHESGIIHGDVKPANILVDHRKRIKLGDFGLARRLSAADGSLVRGTAKYMAPELVSEEFGATGSHSDLYSLGFTAYELMCGTRFDSLFPGLNAFSRDMNAAWMMWHAAPDRKLPDIDRILRGVPADLSHVLQRLSTKDPAKRYSDAGEALADLNLDLPKSGISSSGISAVRADTRAPLDAVKPPPVDRKRRMIIIGAFVCSMILSAAIAFLPTKSPPVTGPLSNSVGVVREINLDRKILEIEDPQSGMPEEVQIADRPRIRLIVTDGPEQLILLKKIQAGDWVEVEHQQDVKEIRELKVSRPRRSTGEVQRVELSPTRIHVLFTNGRNREDVSLMVPPRTTLQLNAKSATLGQFLAGDRIEVDHLVDPRGRLGQIASRIEGFRQVDRVVFLDQLDLSTRQLTGRFSRTTNAKTEAFSLSDDCEAKLTDGQVIPLNELRPDDRLTLVADAVVRKIVVHRNEIELTGDLTAVDETARTITVSVFDAERSTKVLAVPPTATFRLHQQPLQLVDLRPAYDRLTIHASQNAGQLSVATLDIERTIRHDRWAVIIGNSAFLDRTLSPRPLAVADARLIQGTLINRYGFDPQWTSLSVDQNLQPLQADFDRVLGFSRTNAQLLVFISGHAYVDDEGRAYLAPRDFHFDAITRTGLPLASVLDRLEACTAAEKIVMLDVVHTGGGADLQKQPTLGGLLQAAGGPPSHWPTLKFFAPCGLTERAADSPAPSGQFAQILAAAFAGEADLNRDLAVSAEELAAYCTKRYAAIPGAPLITVP